MKSITLYTSRLTLRELTQEHLKDLNTIYSEEQAMQFWDAFPHKDLERTQKLLNMLSGRRKNNTGISWGISLKDDDKIIGTISYNHYQKNGTGFIGYILNKEYWNQGLMAEALEIFVDFGFDELQLHRIEAQVEPGNTASEKLLSKIGFHKEGTFRGRVFYKGQHHDMMVYGLLKEDLINKNSKSSNK